MGFETDFHKIAQRLKASERVLFITGAGVSADSGVPTYRGVGGLYNGSWTEDGIPIEEALSGECFAERPEITLKYLTQIEHNCRKALPNAGHLAIASLEHRLHVVVLTQNVDGLHIQAGSSNVIEIHGTFARRYCALCATETRQSACDTVTEIPQCRHCGGVIRPDIVLFGEQLPRRAVERLLAELHHGFDMLFVIGTTAVFPYISEPVMKAIRDGIPTVEINPVQTLLSPLVDYYLPLGASAAMTAIMRELE